MPRAKFVMSQTQINIDRLGAVRAQLAELQVEHDKLVARLSKTVGKRSGVEFTVNVYDAHNKTFNYARARRLLGASVYDRCWTRNDYRALRLTTMKESKA